MFCVGVFCYSVCVHVCCSVFSYAHFCFMLVCFVIVCVCVCVCMCVVLYIVFSYAHILYALITTFYFLHVNQQDVPV